jgi:hypothetical protein
MANISRRAGDLRDMACGQYTLSHLLSIVQKWDIQEERAAALSGVNPEFIMTGCVGVPTFFVSLLNDISLLKEEQHTILSIPIGNLDEQGRFLRKVIISKHTSKIRDLECKIQFARPGRLLVPPIVANELALHRAVSVRFFDLFRLAASIHLLSELQGTPVNDSAIQLRTTEMVNLLGNIEQSESVPTLIYSIMQNSNFRSFLLQQTQIIILREFGPSLLLVQLQVITWIVSLSIDV